MCVCVQREKERQRVNQLNEDLKKIWDSVKRMLTPSLFSISTAKNTRGGELQLEPEGFMLDKRFPDN